MRPYELMRRMMAAQAGPAPVVQTKLSAINKAPDVVLSNGDIDAEATISMGGNVLSHAGRSSGKFYAECQVMQLHTSWAFAFGLHQGAAGLGTYLGGDSAGWGTWAVNAIRRTRHNAAAGHEVSTENPVAGIRARMAVDLDAGKIWLSYFGSSGWIGGGDPAAGTAPTYAFTPAGMYYIALNPYHGITTPTSSRNKLRLVQPADWAPGSLPAGYSVWGD